jgi:hypothetical protein
MYIIIFFSLIFIISFLVNKQSIVEDVKSENDAHRVYNNKDKIEIGYPTIATRSLHINSSKEPPLPNHNYTNEQLNQFDEDYVQGDVHNKQIYTRNMFVESHYELNISLFERELTVKMVNDAYEKILNEHIDKITNGIPNIFNITEKQEARDYLLNKLNNKTKS